MAMKLNHVFSVSQATMTECTGRGFASYLSGKERVPRWLIVRPGVSDEIGWVNAQRIEVFGEIG